MASGSFLTMRQGLVWHVTNEEFFKVLEKPEFELLNTTWRIEIDAINDRERETGGRFFNIIFQNVGDLQPLPFNVMTFLEDNKNNVHMKCSMVEVSSRDKILYKAKKLPTFNMVNDFTVLFIFSADTDLGLNIKSDLTTKPGIIKEKKGYETSSLQIVQCLIWESRMPRRHCLESPVFSLLNSRCKLEIGLVNSEVAFNSAYQIRLKDAGEVPSYLTTDIKTFLAHEGYYVQYRRSSSSNEEFATCNTLYKVRFESVSPVAKGLEHRNYFIVVSMFSPSAELALIAEGK